MATVKARAEIFGCLPAIAVISTGYDSFTGEYWSELDHLFWRKRDGLPGKEIPKKIRDRVDDGDIIEAAFDYLERLNHPEHEEPK